MFKTNSLYYILFNIWACVPWVYPILAWWSSECVLDFIIIIKSELWIINRCLGLDQKTMARAVCITVFSFFQITDRRPFDTKPLSGPMLMYSKLDHWKQISAKYDKSITIFHTKNCKRFSQIYICLFFGSASMCPSGREVTSRGTERNPPAQITTKHNEIRNHVYTFGRVRCFKQKVTKKQSSKISGYLSKQISYATPTKRKSIRV